MKTLCEDLSTAQRKHGPICAKKLFRRIDEIRASENLAVLKAVPWARCHALTNNRHGQYAVDLEHPKRLILEPKFEEGSFKDEQVTDVEIVDIIDYH